MTHHNPPITTMFGLLEALYCNSLTCRKTMAVLHWDKEVGNEKFYVRQHFDDGGGHSGAFTSDDTPVAQEISFGVMEDHLVEGLIYPGYISKNEFKLSDFGREEYFRLLEKVRWIQGLSPEEFVLEFRRSIARNAAPILDMHRDSLRRFESNVISLFETEIIRRFKQLQSTLMETV